MIPFIFYTSALTNYKLIIITIRLRKRYILSLTTITYDTHANNIISNELNKRKKIKKKPTTLENKVKRFVIHTFFYYYYSYYYYFKEGTEVVKVRL